MQQSFLSNNSEDEYSPQHRKQKIAPKQKMYDIQLTFLNKFKRQIQQIQFGIQALLLSLTNCKEGQKKRLPYNVFRQFDKNLKQIRKLKQKVIEENQKYAQQFLNREKKKIQRNAQFKQYLKQLGNTKQQLKQYISKLQTRVRKLEDAGYAQFIQFDVIVPEQNTIRFSYKCSTLLILTINRSQWSTKVYQQIIKWQKFHKNAKQMKKISYKLDTNDSSQQNDKNDDKQKKSPIMKDKLYQQQGLLLRNAFETYKTYKYFCNQHILLHRLLRLKQKKEQQKLQIQKLKQSLKSAQQTLYKQKLRIGFERNDQTMTRTDHLIYLKQIKNEINQKFASKIFQINEPIKKYRSKSQNIYQYKQR